MANIPAPSDVSGDPIAAAGMLADAMGALGADIRALKTDAQRHRRNMRLLAVTVTFDILLSCALGLVGANALHTSHIADRAAHAATADSVSQLVTCQQGNLTRVDVINVWAKVLAPNDALSPSQQATNARTLTFVRQTYAPRDCSHLGTT